MSTDPVRLEVNIGGDTQAALLRVATQDHITITEALHRLVGIGDRVHRAIREDGDRVYFSAGGYQREMTIDVD